MSGRWGKSWACSTCCRAACGVRRERFRTVAELCEADTGGILWTERLEGSTNEVFALQDRLAERIVTTIAPHVRQAELRRALRKHPENLDVYDFVLRGLDLLYRLRREEFEQARDMFQRAIELEPGYATPYALSANWYSIRIGQGWSVNLSEDVAAVNRLATAALERDPFDTLALALCGHVRSFLLRDFEGAIVLFQRALTGSPNSAEAWLWSSPTYSYIGEGAEAARRAEQSLRLSPVRFARIPEPHRPCACSLHERRLRQRRHGGSQGDRRESTVHGGAADFRRQPRRGRAHRGGARRCPSPPRARAHVPRGGVLPRDPTEIPFAARCWLVTCAPPGFPSEGSLTTFDTVACGEPRSG